MNQKYRTIKEIETVLFQSASSWRLSPFFFITSKMGNPKSPSAILGRSMLSFDLRRRSSVAERRSGDELHVQLGPAGSRKSSGRGTLRSYIQKRIVLQECSNMLDRRREVDRAAVNAEGGQADCSSKSVKQSKSQRTRKGKHKDLKKTNSSLKTETTAAQESHEWSSSRDSTCSSWEIPLGQFDHQTHQLSSTQSANHFPSQSANLSQTQIYCSPSKSDRLGNTTPVATAKAGSSLSEVAETPMSFLPTPQQTSCLRSGSRLSVASGSRLLSPVDEEVVEVASKMPRKKELQRCKFLDIEASESSADCASGDEIDEEENESDVSGLIASGTLSQPESPTDHWKFHMQWELEQERKKVEFRNPAAVEGDERRSKNIKKVAVPRNAKMPSLKRRKDPSTSKRIEQDLIKNLTTKQPSTNQSRRPVTQRNRRSSVSMSGSDIEVVVLKNSSAKSIAAIAAPGFSFIKGPRKSELGRIQKKDQLKSEMESKSAVSQKLNGAKRFVFGVN